VAVDGDLSVVDGYGLDFEPVLVNVIRLLVGMSPAKEYDVGDNRRAFAFEGIRREADRSQEVGSLIQILACRAVVLIEREVAGDQGEHSARPESVDGLREAEIVKRHPHAAVGNPDVGKGRVPDDGIDPLGELGVSEALDANVLAWMKSPRDPA